MFVIALLCLILKVANLQMIGLLLSWENRLICTALVVIVLVETEHNVFDRICFLTLNFDAFGLNSDCSFSSAV